MALSDAFEQLTFVQSGALKQVYLDDLLVTDTAYGVRLTDLSGLSTVPAIRNNFIEREAVDGVYSLATRQPGRTTRGANEISLPFTINGFLADDGSDQLDVPVQEMAEQRCEAFLKMVSAPFTIRCVSSRGGTRTTVGYVTGETVFSWDAHEKLITVVLKVQLGAFWEGDAADFDVSAPGREITELADVGAKIDNAEVIVSGSDVEVRDQGTQSWFRIKGEAGGVTVYCSPNYAQQPTQGAIPVYRIPHGGAVGMLVIGTGKGVPYLSVSSGSIHVHCKKKYLTGF